MQRALTPISPNSPSRASPKRKRDSIDSPLPLSPTTLLATGTAGSAAAVVASPLRPKEARLLMSASGRVSPRNASLRSLHKSGLSARRLSSRLSFDGLGSPSSRRLLADCESDAAATLATNNAAAIAAIAATNADDDGTPKKRRLAVSASGAIETTTTTNKIEPLMSAFAVKKNRSKTFTQGQKRHFRLIGTALAYYADDKVRQTLAAASARAVRCSKN